MRAPDLAPTLIGPWGVLGSLGPPGMSSMPCVSSFGRGYDCNHTVHSGPRGCAECGEKKGTDSLRQSDFKVPPCAVSSQPTSEATRKWRMITQTIMRSHDIAHHREHEGMRAVRAAPPGTRPGGTARGFQPSAPAWASRVRALCEWTAEASWPARGHLHSAGNEGLGLKTQVTNPENCTTLCLPVTHPLWEPCNHHGPLRLSAVARRRHTRQTHVQWPAPQRRPSQQGTTYNANIGCVPLRLPVTLIVGAWQPPRSATLPQSGLKTIHGLGTCAETFWGQLYQGRAVHRGMGGGEARLG